MQRGVHPNGPIKIIQIKAIIAPGIAPIVPSNFLYSPLKNIPAIVILKCLGLTKEAEIAKYIGHESDCLIVNLYEYAKLKDSEEAMMFLAETAGIQGKKKEIIDRVKQRIDSFFLPHIGLDKAARQ